MEFEGKVALITGGSRGIGRETAIELASRGAIVVINYSASEDAAKETKHMVEKRGGKALLSQFDVSDFDTVQKEINKVLDEFGHIDILVNNAGITRDGLFLRMKQCDWDIVFAVNVKGVFNCTKAVIRTMLNRRFGRIINITSVVGEMGNPGQINYSSSKSSIIGFTKSAAKEFGQRGITVNAVSPGFIETDITRDIPDRLKQKYLEQIPLGRFGTPKDVSKVVAFLASEDASYITGEVIRVNGGMYT